MNKSDIFDNTIRDSQGSDIHPVEISAFPFSRYQEYETALLENNRSFWNNSEGIAVYRRFRATDCFSQGCRDRDFSLKLQLGALLMSMDYKADIANFLEPWYGIGTVSSAFGTEYDWVEGQAPVPIPPFRSVQEACSFEPVPVENTPIGRHTLEMIEFFLEKTAGRLPISFTDTQSPLNIASSLVNITELLITVFDDPESLHTLLSTIADLQIDFAKKQMDLIGDALVWPGHGFASSRVFEGLGMSDDNMIMLSPEQYEQFEVPLFNRISEAMGGVAFHSCGDWSDRISSVLKIKGLRAADGAFSMATDPDPNPTEPFRNTFPGTGIALNVRIVGSPDTVEEKVNKLQAPGMKIAVITYGKTPEEQEEIYRRVHGQS